MIANVLFKRYPNRWIISARVPTELSTLIRQAAMIVFDDIAAILPNRTRVFENAEKQLARELGASHLGRHSSAEQNCLHFLGEHYDIWNDAHGAPDDFFKFRLSLIELLFRETEAILRSTTLTGDTKNWPIPFRTRPQPTVHPPVEHSVEALAHGIDELNARFRQVSFPFEYHNGFIQRSDDELTTSQIENPFWSLVADSKWKNVDTDMKEAIDRRDAGKGDAALYALKAFESTIRILSDDLGRTSGTEKGAAAYIDNLVAAKPQRFVEVWESDSMKSLFRALRNPMAHGAGNTTQLTLTGHQSTYVIETVMAWIKSLVRRKP